MSARSLIRRLVVEPFAGGRLLATLAAFPRFYRQWREFRRHSPIAVRIGDWFPRLGDDTAITPFDPHYFYQSAWAARCIARSRVREHTDVGSQIDLIAPLTGFVKVEFIDLRPLNAQLANLRSRAGSILALPHKDGSVRSLSCLHVLEHIGLG